MSGAIVNKVLDLLGMDTAEEAYDEEEAYEEEQENIEEDVIKELKEVIGVESENND